MEQREEGGTQQFPRVPSIDFLQGKRVEEIVKDDNTRECDEDTGN